MKEFGNLPKFGGNYINNVGRLREEREITRARAFPRQLIAALPLRLSINRMLPEEGDSLACQL